jgi:hypothetical protein
MFPLHLMLRALVRWIGGEQQGVIEYEHYNGHRLIVGPRSAGPGAFDMDARIRLWRPYSPS